MMKFLCGQSNIILRSKRSSSLAFSKTVKNNLLSTRHLRESLLSLTLLSSQNIYVFLHAQNKGLKGDRMKVLLGTRTCHFILNHYVIPIKPTLDWSLQKLLPLHLQLNTLYLLHRSTLSVHSTDHVMHDSLVHVFYRYTMIANGYVTVRSRSNCTRMGTKLYR